MLNLDPTSTALVLIDLQDGIVNMNLSPRDGQTTVATGRALAEKARASGVKVVLVHVGFASDFADAPSHNVDARLPLPEGGLPAGWSDLVSDLRQEGDLVVYKRQWGAFTGTDLDLQLRRRGIRTIVLGGIATNFGVESTLRHAWELGYDIVVPEDACTSADANLHRMTIEHVFPRLARVVTASELSFEPVTSPAT
ncbi:isochorismatase hydrolase [Neoasaia chiangmaiensis NBRC 101099]|uniref:Hydrolase n=1 Tax=Neoasaia chiangmaiensis TaxID=320497 RepID=A0A1U9KSI3_9PROT|nr:hydrolase [Neoasaia chiangmaiensis]AQS88768.1 hydrolase [Neoasaia chiangmaiensis]GBR40805.1 isochorismatase hydrolase [Neoasaia chiangmaiensis NBRC 101099]GEN13729.1 hydrolase [Neoasaia chiangmaiensis]